MVNDLYLKDLDQNLIEDEKYNLRIFSSNYREKNKDWLQESSLNTWILMEACNLSSRLKKKISIKELKVSCYLAKYYIYEKNINCRGNFRNNAIMLRTVT